MVPLVVIAVATVVGSDVRVTRMCRHCNPGAPGAIGVCCFIDVVVNCIDCPCRNVCVVEIHN
jgi:hypothetical protein